MSTPLRRSSFALLLGACLAFGAAGAMGCGKPRTTNELVADLRSPDWSTRRGAADDLRTDAGVPEEAIAPLVEAAKAEKNPPALGAMLITLGRSGKPEARPLIDENIKTDDPDMRRWAGRALKYWMIATGEKKESDVFPEGWPYGQPGYPAKLPEK